MRAPVSRARTAPSYSSAHTHYAGRHATAADCDDEDTTSARAQTPTYEFQERERGRFDAGSRKFRSALPIRRVWRSERSRWARAGWTVKTVKRVARAFVAYVRFMYIAYIRPARFFVDSSYARLPFPGRLSLTGAAVAFARELQESRSRRIARETNLEKIYFLYFEHYYHPLFNI